MLSADRRARTKAPRFPGMGHGFDRPCRDLSCCQISHFDFVNVGGNVKEDIFRENHFRFCPEQKTKHGAPFALGKRSALVRRLLRAISLNVPIHCYYYSVSGVLEKSGRMASQEQDKDA